MRGTPGSATMKGSRCILTFQHFNSAAANKWWIILWIYKKYYIHSNPSSQGWEEWTVRLSKCGFLPSLHYQTSMLVRCTTKLKFFNILLCSLTSEFSKNRNQEGLQLEILFMLTAIYKAISRIYQDTKLYEEC